MVNKMRVEGAGEVKEVTVSVENVINLGNYESKRVGMHLTVTNPIENAEDILFKYISAKLVEYEAKIKKETEEKRRGK